MSKDFLDHLQRIPLVQEPRRDRVPQIVEAELGHPDGFAGRVKGLLDVNDPLPHQLLTSAGVARAHYLWIAVGEHRSPAERRVRLQSSEEIDGLIDKRDGQSLPEAAAVLDDQRQPSGLQIDHLPIQADDVSLPEPRQQSKLDHRPGMRDDGGDQLISLVAFEKYFPADRLIEHEL